MQVCVLKQQMLKKPMNFVKKATDDFGAFISQDNNFNLQCSGWLRIDHKSTF